MLGSSTVTVAVPVAMFPLVSVAVMVTVCSPIDSHVKLSGEIVHVAIVLHASVLPLSNCAAVTIAVPPSVIATVAFCSVSTGTVLSAITTF